MSFGNTANNQESSSKGSAPVATFKVGGVKVDVWENKSDKGTFNSFSMQRSYKAGDEWKNTGSLRQQDIPKAVLALQQAFEASFKE